MEARGRKRSDEPAQFAVRLVRSTVGNHGRVVHQSAGHLPDFRIDYNDGRVAIGEVAAHVDPAVQSLWAEAAKHDHLCALQAGLGIWRVWLSKDANVKRLHSALPDLITDLALYGVFDLTLQATWPPGPLADRARELKIDHIRRGVVDGSDVAWYSLGPTGGWEPDDGNLVVDWLDALVVDPAYLDLTNKLQIQLADELHIFVVTGSATPHDADSALRQIDRIAPTRDPDLPGWITHAWVVSQWASGRSAGLWTRGQGWSIVPI